MSFLKPNSTLILVLLLLLTRVGAQPAPPEYYQTKFSSIMAIIIVVSFFVLFLIGFLSLYIRHCSDTSSISTVRNIGNSLRRRTATRGLDGTVLDTFPVFGYSEVKDKKIGKGTLECAVCLNEFEETDSLRLIPKCNHVFHPECIDTWIESHVTCPVCRADLSDPVQTSETKTVLDHPGEVSIRIAEEPGQEPVQTSESVSVPPRLWSVRWNIRPKLPRSHTTGHSLVQPGHSLVQSGENVDRFTLWLPETLRKEVMTRAALNRTTSCLVVGLPTESSSKRGYRTGTGFGEGSGLKRVDPVAKSDQWVFTMVPPFFSREASMRSPREDGDMADEEGSTSSSKTPRVAMKLPSFKCLEPKGDETHLVPGESSTQPSV